MSKSAIPLGSDWRKTSESDKSKLGWAGIAAAAPGAQSSPMSFANAATRSLRSPNSSSTVASAIGEPITPGGPEKEEEGEPKRKVLRNEKGQVYTAEEMIKIWEGMNGENHFRSSGRARSDLYYSVMPNQPANVLERSKEEKERLSHQLSSLSLNSSSNENVAGGGGSGSGSGGVGGTWSPFRSPVPSTVLPNNGSSSDLGLFSPAKPTSLFGSPSTSAPATTTTYGATPPPPPPGISSPQPSLIMPENILWMYKDPSDKEYGPYNGRMMHDWYMSGWLQEDLMIRRTEEAEFITLKSFKEKVNNSFEPFLVPLPVPVRSTPGFNFSSQQPGPQTQLPPQFPQDPFARQREYLRQQQQQQQQPFMGPFGGTQPQPMGWGASPWGAFASPYSPSGANNTMPMMMSQQMPSQQIDQTLWNITSTQETPLGGLEKPFEAPPIGQPQKEESAESPITTTTATTMTTTTTTTTTADTDITATATETTTTGPSAATIIEQKTTIIEPVKPEPTPEPKEEAPEEPKEPKKKQKEEAELAKEKPAKKTKQPISPAPARSETPSPEPAEEPLKPTKPSVAPWAEKKPEKPKAPSLKEIQELEAAEQKARQAQLQQQQQAQLQAAAAAAAKSATTPSLPSGATWGTGLSNSPTATKTLTQIQQEEAALARAKAAKATTTAATTISAATITKRYAEIGNASSAAAATTTGAGGAWTTVGPGGKKPSMQPQAPPQSRPVATTVASNGKRVVGSTAAPVTVAPAASQLSSREAFLHWCKSSIQGLNQGVNQTELLSMLLSLPPTSDSREIIADTIYSNSTTMDGRRFADEFIKRRKESGVDSPSAAGTSWSDILHKAPQPDNEGWNSSFKVVTKKKKKAQN
ncbi:hypothetical protein TRVA0_028S01750 [Trichomonascus vanleenenianus]|uniref:Smy2p n=1 Tax=Trichomonascus vanleenenianus TaxID=2268995 RepID=UPI003ECB6741